MSAFRHHMRLWATWMLSISALLMFNPWWDFGWVELAATFGPLAMAIERRIWREPALAIGIPTITLLWLADPAAATVPHLLVAWILFVGGVLLAARTMDSQMELEAIAGQVAFLPPGRESIEQFRLALAREIGRARRHERTFVVLSIGVEADSTSSKDPSRRHGELWQAVAENRARLELRDLLRAELHVYSEVAIDGERVLALVPEIGPSAIETLTERLRKSAHEHVDFPVQIGVGRFPQDALCAEELIETADKDRKVGNLLSLPERRIGVVSSEEDELTPDVQG